MNSDPRALDASTLSSPQPAVPPQKAPAALSTVASAQFIIALLLLLSVAVVAKPAPDRTVSDWALVLYPAGLFFLAGTGLSLGRGWGWWLTCCIYFHVLCSVPTAILLGAIQRQAIQMGDHLPKLVVSILMLAYLHRRQLLRFIRFQGPDGRPARMVLASPIIVGGVTAIVRFVVESVAF